MSELSNEPIDDSSFCLLCVCRCVNISKELRIRFGKWTVLNCLDECISTCIFILLDA